jgi:hypothetical protein
MANENRRQKCDIGEIFRSQKEEFLNQANLLPQQQKAYQDISACRTSKLKGHIRKCDKCDFRQNAYNSCRNKHCPKCQFLKQLKWVDNLESKLFDCKYFHVVFTVPHSLNSLFYKNQKLMYTFLMQSAWEAVSKAANNPEFLGAETGAIAVLHTWTQVLTYHPHVHMIIPCGGLSEDQMEWIACEYDFLAPKRVLRSLFRGILCSKISEAIASEQLYLPDELNWKKLKNKLYAVNWNMHIEKSLKGVQGVLNYLGEYTHKVAISNQRISDFTGKKTSFWYRGRNRNVNRKIELDTKQFIQRFLQHILPFNFYRIRYYGILSSGNSKTKREQVMALLESFEPLPKYKGLCANDIFKLLTGRDILKCPKCEKGKILCSSIPKPET